MPCGISSRLVQVTVVPAFTFSSFGEKVKLSIDTVLDGPSARASPTPAASTEPTAAPSRKVATIGRNIFALLKLAAARRALNHLTVSSLRFTSSGLSQTYTGWLIVMSMVGHAPTPGEPITATI